MYTTTYVLRSSDEGRSWSKPADGNLTDMLLQHNISMMQVILPPASAVSNEGPSPPLLVLLPAVSWPSVPADGPLERPHRDGENAQNTGKSGGKMGEIQPKTCEGRELTKDQLAVG